MDSTHDLDPDEPDHVFVAYDANPSICRVCGAVKPMPCFKVCTPAPCPDVEPTVIDSIVTTHDDGSTSSYSTGLLVGLQRLVDEYGLRGVWHALADCGPACANGVFHDLLEA